MPYEKEVSFLKKPIVIAVCNQKGGCAKTTTVTETLACLAQGGARVLGIDLDHQCNFTETLGHDPEEETPGAYELLTGKKQLEEVVLESKVPNLYFVPASIDLSAAESELMGIVGREHQLRIALAGAVEGKYDYILLDNPPNLGVLVMNALTAADFMIVPVQVYKFARRGLDRITDLYELVKQRLNPGLKDWMVLPTKLDFRRAKDVEKLRKLREEYGVKVFSSQIHENSMILESQEVGTPVVVMDKHGTGAKQYRCFANELSEWVAKGVARVGAAS